jgi:hypothetical protein
LIESGEELLGAVDSEGFNASVGQALQRRQQQQSRPITVLTSATFDTREM